MRTLSNRDARILLTGPDPEKPMGGVAVAMGGYKAALENADLLAGFIPSYRAGARGTRWWFALRAVGELLLAVRRVRKEGSRPIVYGHGSRWLSLLRQALILYAMRVLGTDTMLHLHSQAIDRYLQTRLGRCFLRFCFAPARRICVLTRWWRERLVEAGVRKPVFVIPNPLPPQLESTALDSEPSSQAASAAHLRLLAMTRLVAGKGVDLAIRTLRELPSTVSLTVAGEGNQLASLQRLAHQLSLNDRVVFTGWVEGTRKAELYRTSHIYLLPTQEDSFGMSFVEAMAYGVPVIALRWGSIQYVVPDGEAGILVERASPEHLALAVRRLMDPTLQRKMGAAGKRWVLEEFTSKTVGRRLREAVAALPAGS